ncbi:MAG: hypothetical protein A2493_00160 [Candidatus Magasanikbacteria bacterium RIFOXYC12_FULL_33_11]|uniref:N-acetyltransferase domain-containing protein n=1 Tax=Candidatus Magasanikbacteria bacterium RIFOXYC12_FULL_33_11 TaxID=1798701 RepID=A0A1F6NRM0_9BACT|nr:MAG: hypothetical protein A2493_00160 [Candidatus Magasanikbacteria bacterium RIFOXYC12_FULL_33_11]
MEHSSEEIRYNNPKQNLEKQEEPMHTMDLVLNGEIIGRAEMTYYSKPVPLYQVSDLYVEPAYHGKGYASQIMSQVELFLKKHKRAGVIVDAIDIDSPASGMYSRRGWQEIPGESGLYVYNIPPNATLKDFQGYALRQTDITTRDSWEKKSII